MRKAEKEISDEKKIVEILETAELLRLAMVDKGEPYIVAMNFVYVEGALYMHCAREGRKIDILNENNRVAFQMDTGVELLMREDACSSTARYLSVFGTGRAFFIDEPEDKIKILDALMKKHSGKDGFNYPEKAIEKTLVIKVEIDQLTGKKSGY